MKRMRRLGHRAGAAWLLAVALLLGGCAQDAVLPAAVSGGQHIDDRELAQQVFAAVNRFREEKNLPPLQRDARLDRVAEEYCRQMIRENNFSHHSRSGERPEERLERAGIDDWQAAGENLARNRNARDPVDAAVRGWEISPGHLQNLLEKRYRRAGIAAVSDGMTGYTYIVQMYID